MQFKKFLNNGFIAKSYSLFDAYPVTTYQRIEKPYAKLVTLMKL